MIFGSIAVLVLKIFLRVDYPFKAEGGPYTSWRTNINDVLSLTLSILFLDLSLQYVTFHLFWRDGSFVSGQFVEFQLIVDECV